MCARAQVKSNETTCKMWEPIKRSKKQQKLVYGKCSIVNQAPQWSNVKNHFALSCRVPRWFRQCFCYTLAAIVVFFWHARSPHWFIWSSGFFTVIKFSADTCFLQSLVHCRLRSPSQRLCKYLTGIEFHFTSAWQVRQCFILFSQRFWNCSSASSPPEGADFFLFSALPQKASKAETRKWRQELCSISPVDPSASSHLCAPEVFLPFYKTT